MDIFKKIAKSIYGPEFYRNLLSQPFSFSAKYLALFTLLFSLALAGVVSLRLIPEVSQIPKAVRSGVVENFPDQIEIVISKGAASTNTEGVVEIKTPASWSSADSQVKNPANLVVVDIESEASADKLMQYDTAVLLTKKYIVYQDGNGEITTQTLANVPDMTISRQTLGSFVDKYSPLINLLVPLLALFVAIGAWFIVGFNLIYLLLAALPIWLIAKVKKVEIGYVKAYQLGMHLMTLPLLLSLLPIGFKLMFTSVLLILAAININNKPGVQPVAPPTSGPAMA